MVMDNKFKSGVKVGQYLNTAGVRVFLRALFKNREYFKPHFTVANVNYIKFKTLHEHGIKYVVFDKDNTLSLPYEREIHPSI